ncbi:MAG: BrnA antitoxin family protein [Nitrospirae bacterium]|nr:BrnA antitoxin family protein [Nitrospirota bacterium]
MRKKKKVSHINTDAEEAAIKRGISLDPDNPELTDSDFEKMRPASEVMPQLVKAYRRTRGPQKNPTKTQLTVRLSQDVVEFFKSSGRGWQTNIDKALKEYVRSHA